MKTTMTTSREYASGEIVEPGTYVDVETGSVVEIRQADELPEGRKMIQYRRRFRRVEEEKKELVGSCR